MADNPRIEELRRRLDREPGSRLFAQLAEELRKDGDYAEAIRVARSGLAAQPNYPSARMTLGRALLDSGDLAGARVEFEAVLRGAPDNILASRFLAECLEGLGDLGSALLQYRAAQRLAPSDKNLEAQIHALEQKLSMPTLVRRVAELAEAPAPLPPSAPPAAAPPAAPPPRASSPPARTGSLTAEFETPPGSRAPAPPAVGRPARPAPPEPEPLASPTLVEESFDLEAPFNVSTPLRAEQSATLPGRTLPDEPGVPEAPTLPVTRAPSFEAMSTFHAVEFREPEPPWEPASEVAEAPGPEPDRVAEAQWRAPAPPRRHPLDETPEAGSRSPVAPPAGSESVDTTRVPVVVLPITGPEPKPLLHSVRLEWAPAPAPPGAPGAPEVPPSPPAPPPEPRASPPPYASPAPAAAAPEPAPATGPLLSPTLAELYLDQGALDKAIEVYEQLRQREPANERHRARLAEIRRPAPPPSGPAGDPRAARRRAIEAEIARLEQLLAVVRRP